MRTVGVVLVVLAMVLAGCSGGENPFGEGGGAGTADGGGSFGSDGGSGGDGASGGSGSSTDWCQTGTSYSYASPQTGEQVSLEVQGVVSYDGRQVCKATWTSNDGQVQKMEMYYSEDDSYTKIVMYDGNGNVIGEYGGTTGGTGGSVDGTDGGAVGGGSSGSFCQAGSSYSFANPQTGEQVALEVQGMVSHDGRQVCKATWTTNEGQIQRMEMYYTEDGSYQKVIMYDGNGNVVGEYGGSTGSTGGN